MLNKIERNNQQNVVKTLKKWSQTWSQPSKASNFHAEKRVRILLLLKTQKNDAEKKTEKGVYLWRGLRMIVYLLVAANCSEEDEGEFSNEWEKQHVLSL